MRHEVTDSPSIATLAGGCFWCLEPVFADLQGVAKVVAGYTGGTVKNPSYEAVCAGTTGHAEAVQVTFDSTIITYEDLLEIFFSIHDPTTLNRQGADVGTQYRSAIFYHDDEQKTTAEKIVAALDSGGDWRNPIVTEVTPFREYFPAEDYHQGYFNANGKQPYCQMIVAPKLAKFRKRYADRLKA